MILRTITTLTDSSVLTFITGETLACLAVHAGLNIWTNSRVYAVNSRTCDTLCAHSREKSRNIETVL